MGNHTYSHRSANNVPVDEFLDDVIKGEVIMEPLLKQHGKALTWLRYPYLHSGTTAEVHDIIVTFLDRRGYRVAPVTVDYADYSFAGVYRRELRAGNVDVAERIKQAYLDQVDVGFDRAERASVEVFGREIAQILLIHCNELNSVSLAESIGRMRKRGYQFISLEEAMRDEAYSRPDTFAGSGGSWISRSARALGKELTLGGQPPLPQWIQDATEAIEKWSGELFANNSPDHFFSVARDRTAPPAGAGRGPSPSCREPRTACSARTPTTPARTR